MIRQDIVDALDRYATLGCPTGGFLQSVLENNLYEAVGRADQDNAATLVEIVRYVYNDLPALCWGSPEKVKTWLERKLQERLAPAD